MQIEQQGSLGDYDVAVKSAPATPLLSTRAVYLSFDEVIVALREIAQAVRTQVAAVARESMIVVAHCDFDDENLDLEIGVTLNRAVNKPVRLPSGGELALTELPASDTLATIVRTGPLAQSHLAFGRLGVWMEANDYAIAGPCREIFLDMPFQVPGDPAVEIQFPVTKAA